MAKKTGKPASKSVSALDILLEGSQHTASTSALSEQFSSVMSLANASIPRLMEQNPQMHISEARDLHGRAQAMSVVIARQFREQRLTASVRHANRPPTGVKGLVDGPTYTDMFNPDWANHCPPDAIEATTSPVAYLADLYRYAKALEATGKQGEVITLDERRPDLKDLVLDHTALNRVEPTLVLVNEILETSIRSHLDGIGLEDKSVDDALLDARYPNTLPFERYTSQINHALGRKDRTLGDAIRAADPAYPYFKEPGVHSLLSDTALIQDTGFGPVQQGLLLEAPYFPDEEGATHPLGASGWRINPRTGVLTKANDANDANDASAFYGNNFGVNSLIDLDDTQNFCLRTGLSTEALEALLSVGAFAISRSENVPGEGEVDGSLSGSVYINAGQTPAMGLETVPADTAAQTGAHHRITHITADRVDRMNRMIRLARWLDLPFDEVDQLLVASMQGEQRRAQTPRRAEDEVPNPWRITQDTLRALGLFQSLRRRHHVVAEDFAAMLYGLNLYGRGNTASQFDRVFNGQALFSVPLILDDQPFERVPETEEERQKIDHLCAALGMTFETYRYAARVLLQASREKTLKWSRETVSAFYRLVRLPRCLGLSTIEALALLELLDGGGSLLVSRLAGVTQIASFYESVDTDTLSVIHALADAALWLKENDWSVVQLCRLVLTSITEPVATDAEKGLLQQIHGRLGAALITDSSFAETGAPEATVTQEMNEEGVAVYVSETIDWFEELKDFIETGNPESAPNAKGLVKYVLGETEESFERAMSDQVEAVLRSKGLLVEELHPKISNMIMRARGAQEALLMEGLGGYLNTSADVAKALLFWTDGNRYQLLKEVLRVYGVHAAGSVAIGDDVLLVLEALSKRAVLANHLGLSSALITQLIAEPTWFGLANSALTLQLVYFSGQYAAMLRLSEQSEDALLNYLRLINTVWSEATEGDQRLIRDSASNMLARFLRWGVREVLEVAYQFNDDGVVFTLKDLETVARVSLLSHHTSLDAKALLALHNLTPTRPVMFYRQAAEMALACLTDSAAKVGGEAGQSVASTLTVAPDYLVARREGDEAVYTITLRDVMDVPYDNVTVRWSTDLGELSDVETTTDTGGVSTVKLGSGTTMGLATVVASFGLGETLYAPVVTIDCDETSIQFHEPQIGPTQALSNNLEPIIATVALADQYGNNAIDRPVKWGATLGEFKRHQTYTDQNGVARAELRSRPAGISEVVATYSNGQIQAFNPVEFTSTPYFRYVTFADSIIEGIEVQVTCSLVELDGVTPRPDVDVTWEALDEQGQQMGNLTPSASKTDENGIATVKFLSGSVGNVQVTVSALDVDSALSKTSALTVIHPMPAIVSQATSHEDFLVGNSEPVLFSVWVEAGGEVAAGMPVHWRVTKKGEPEDDTTFATSRTNQLGKASFSSKFSLGNHVISATVGGTAVRTTFDMLARNRVVFTMAFEGDLVDPESPDLISRIAPYALVVKALDAQDETRVVEGVSFTLSAVGDDPRLIGLDIQGLNEKYRSTPDGVRFAAKASRGSVRGDFTLLATTRFPLEKLESTYRLGWLYAYYSAVLKAGQELALTWVCVQGELSPYDGSDVDELGVVEFEVPEKKVDVQVHIPLKQGRPLYSAKPEANLAQLEKDDVTHVSRLVAMDGYMVALAGTQPLQKDAALKPTRSKRKS
ncbi:Tc toxin subunit A [Pseudomonas sp. RC10]|uniref:Tc toxin subunit A n=1 Tax=Pseudomonas bambusae TaxID=3139142 RepID=UPI0031386DA5